MNIYRILKKPFFGNFMVKWRSPLTEEEQKKWQKMMAKSKSGATLHALFATVENPKATLVLGHPMGKEAKGYFIKNGYTKFLLENGFNVLVFDINGFGESTIGNFFYFEDIVAIGQHAKLCTPNLKIGYHGISLGGQWATIAFADDAHVYDFAIIESVATTLDEFWIMFPPAYKVLQIFNFLMPKMRKKIRMIDRIGEAKRLESILFIYSLTDTWTPVSMGERFKNNCKIKAELWTVPEAQHASIMRSNYKEIYKNKILKYFNESI